MKKNMQEVRLNQKQKQQLESMLKKGRWTPREIKRAEILLEAHRQGRNLNKMEVGRRLHCSMDKVYRVINRFRENHNIEEALFELPRPGQPEKLNEQEKAYIIATACSETPMGTNHWSLKLLNGTLRKKYGKKVSNTPIRRVLLENELKPWKKKDVVYP